MREGPGRFVLRRASDLVAFGFFLGVLTVGMFAVLGYRVWRRVQEEGLERPPET